MFPNSWFPQEYFPPGYFPKTGAELIVVEDCWDVLEFPHALEVEACRAGLTFAHALEDWRD